MSTAVEQRQMEDDESAKESSDEFTEFIPKCPVARVRVTPSQPAVPPQNHTLLEVLRKPWPFFIDFLVFLIIFVSGCIVGSYVPNPFPELIFAVPGLLLVAFTIVAHEMWTSMEDDLERMYGPPPPLVSNENSNKMKKA